MNKLAAILLLLCATAFALDLTAPAIDLNIITQVNNNPKSSWKAGVNAKFANMTIGQAKSLLSFVPPTAHRDKMVTFSDDSKYRTALPDAYDVDEQYPDCFIDIVQQGDCQISWAAPIVQSVGNRYCISEAKKGKKFTPLLSTQYLISCEDPRGGWCCRGGFIDNAFIFIGEQGLPTEKCLPYISKDASCPTCPSTCQDGSKLQLNKVIQTGSSKVFDNVEDAMNDIMTYGYIGAAIVVQDFLQYQSGVYYHQFGAQMGVEGIRISGWGVDKDTGMKYWIVALLWGNEWGIKGYAWVKRGTNESEIEHYLTSALPFDE